MIFHKSWHEASQLPTRRYHPDMHEPHNKHFPLRHCELYKFDHSEFSETRCKSLDPTLSYHDRLLTDEAEVEAPVEAAAAAECWFEAFAPFRNLIIGMRFAAFLMWVNSTISIDEITQKAGTGYS